MSLSSSPPSGPLWHGPTMGTLTLRALRRYPGRIAFADDSGQLSYAGATELIGRFQRVLDARGLRRGDRVGLLAGNTARAWCAGIAVQASGLAASWLHPLGSVDDQLYQLADLDAAACIVDADRFPERAGVLSERTGDVAVLGLGGGGSAVPDLMSEVSGIGAATARDVAQPNDLGLVNYTGGTTGRPKGVLRRQSAVPWLMTLGTTLDFEIPAGARYLAVAPITHVAGTKVLPVLSRGGTVYLQTGFDPKRVLTIIQRERISMSLMVPTMIYGLLDHPDLDRTDLSSLELLLYGAAPMSPTRLAEGIERIGPVFCQTYGQTECYPITVLHRAEHSDPTLAGSCGSPVSAVSVALHDQDGNPVAPGEPGEICARGPAVMEGYWRQPELTEAAFTHGWLRTGDVARADDRGYLTIVDRTKDMIISGGFNVFPREIEDALTSHEAVAMAAVFGVPDEKWGEAVTAAVVLRPGAEVTEVELAHHVRERKGSVQTPKELRFVDALPTTAVGKIDKKVLRASWGETRQETVR